MYVISLEYKYKSPAIVSRRSNQPIQITFFFGSVPTLRSRSSVDLGEFFNKQGCIGSVDLGLSISTIMAYTLVSKAASIKFDFHCELEYKLVIDLI